VLNIKKFKKTSVRGIQGEKRVKLPWYMIFYAPKANFFLACSARDLFQKQTYFIAKHAQNK